MGNTQSATEAGTGTPGAGVGTRVSRAHARLSGDANSGYARTYSGKGQHQDNGSGQSTATTTPKHETDNKQHQTEESTPSTSPVISRDRSGKRLDLGPDDMPLPEYYNASSGKSESGGATAVLSTVTATTGPRRTSLQGTTLEVTNTHHRLPEESDEHTVPVYVSWNQGGSKVYVAGTFNGWTKKVKLDMSTSDFSTVLNLPLGTHRLRFLVDGEWRCSNGLATATDSAGNLVNYVEVADEDTQLLEDNIQHGTSVDEVKPEITYSNEIPAFMHHRLATAHQYSVRDPEVMPPTLPPHLEKVILNANAAMKEDMSVLPNPNYVVLNHLAASSIKSNTLAVSATTRYRRKFVTTILYKPVSTTTTTA